MPTIPLDPLFDDERFLEASIAVRAGLVSLVFYVVRYRKYDISKDKDFRKYTNLDHNTWGKHKDTILTLYNDLMPKIVDLKGRNLKLVAPAMAKNRAEAKIRKQERALMRREELAANKPPLEPQRSSAAEKIRRTRITSEEEYIQQPNFTPTSYDRYAKEPQQSVFTPQSPSMPYKPKLKQPSVVKKPGLVEKPI